MPMPCEFVMNATVLYSIPLRASVNGSDDVNLGGRLVQQSRLGMVAS